MRSGVVVSVCAYVLGNVYVRFGRKFGESFDIGLNWKNVKTGLYLDGFVRPVFPTATPVGAAWKSGDSVAAVSGGGTGAGGVAEVKPRWMFSRDAIEVLLAYGRMFPGVFLILDSEGFDVRAESLGGVHTVERIVKWISQVKCPSVRICAANVLHCNVALNHDHRGC